MVCSLPLSVKILSNGAIFPAQCCPSPYHGYPGGLNISIPEDKQGNVEWIYEQIDKKVVEGGNAGRMGTWVLPANMNLIYSLTAFGVDLCEGKTDIDDLEYLKDTFRREYGVELSFRLLPKVQEGEEV